MNFKIKQLLNDQINKELYSAYMYLDISNYYGAMGLKGFASWFKKQAREEVEHADKFIEYLLEEGEKVQLKNIEVNKDLFKDIKGPLVKQLEHEKYVTSLIYNIYKEASNINDYRLLSFLNWFVDEQTEEERTAKDILDKFELLKDAKQALFILDNELAKRK